MAFFVALRRRGDEIWLIRQNSYCSGLDADFYSGVSRAVALGNRFRSQRNGTATAEQPRARGGLGKDARGIREAAGGTGRLGREGKTDLEGGEKAFRTAVRQSCCRFRHD